MSLGLVSVRPEPPWEGRLALEQPVCWDGSKEESPTVKRKTETKMEILVLIETWDGRCQIGRNIGNVCALGK